MPRYLKKKQPKGKRLGVAKEDSPNLYAHRKYREFRRIRMEAQRILDEIEELELFRRDKTIPLDDHLVFIKSKYPLCNTCKQSGKVTPGRVYDHIIPVERGTQLYATKEEMQWMCDDCHNRKRATEDKST